MKYTDEEIINKFSKVNFDKTGFKKQAIFNKVAQKCAGRRVTVMKKYHLLIAAAAIVLIAVPALLMNSGIKYGDIKTKQDLPAAQTEAVQNTPRSAETPAAAAQEPSSPLQHQQAQTNQAVTSDEETDLAAALEQTADAAPQLESQIKEETARMRLAERESVRIRHERQSLSKAASRGEPTFGAASASRGIWKDGGSLQMGRSANGGIIRQVYQEPTQLSQALIAAQSAFSQVYQEPTQLSQELDQALVDFSQGYHPAHYDGGIIRQVYQEPAQLSQDTKGYNENGFKKAALEPLSTFSADVDTASYNMLKEQINRGWNIQKDGVRTEALINNFAYDYPQLKGNDPIGINIEYAPAPWNSNNRLVRIGVKAKDINKKDLPQSNLVFLIDVSGSMNGSNRLPLVKQAFKMLLDQLDKNDIVSIVTYASGVNIRLDGARVQDKQKIIEVIDSLRAGGATFGEEGLKRAYETAKKNFLRKGNNRIIIASDGDFNVGNSTVAALEKQVTDAKESGVFISALGFGMGNYRDNMMETIADKGNGNYAYINDLKAAQKALVREFGGTMFTVAKDVKFQVEFNPANVEEYRLIGYEKRLLNNEDFNDDKKDAGEVGAGHSVTVLYEIRPKGSAEKQDIDPLKYARTEYTDTDEVLTVKMRYKDPDGDSSKLISTTLKKKDFKAFDKTSDDFRFASAAAAFGQLVKDGQYLNGFTAEQIADIASKAKGIDDSGDRAEFVQMIRTYAATPKQEATVQVYRQDDVIHPAPGMIIEVK